MKPAFAAALGLIAAVVGGAQTPVLAQAPSTPSALAALAAPASATVCAGCHGAAGMSPQSDVPSLAGQPKQFITTQLVMFREGNRQHAAMNAVAAGLRNADINALGAHYAALPLVPAAPPAADSVLAAGRARAEALNCTQCHGATLLGQQHIPRLAGQHADYLRVQLQGFKAQTRYDMDGNMTAAAQALTPADIELLSTYLAALR